MSDVLFLSVADTAAALGVSDDLVYDLIERGEMPAATLGRRKVVPRLALDRLVEQTLDGFDPDRLARVVGLSPAAPGERPSGQAGTPSDTPPVPG